MSSPAETPALPPAVQSLLELFEGPLAEVHFPDVDGDRLRAGVDEVERRRAALQARLEAVQEARAELEAARAELRGCARKAHAYATIFAEGDDELSGRLAAIELDGAVAKKRRGRPRKAQPKDTLDLSGRSADGGEPAREQASLAAGAPRRRGAKRAEPAAAEDAA